ncbi:MAG: hypothetical protein RSA29_14270 [Clostridium sp.]|uniref:hypothetical protein n=1 Tax=Clostridium sp. TaxID=1506 RepID=UPI00321677C2
MELILRLIVLTLLAYEFKINKKIYYIPPIIYFLTGIIDIILKHTVILSKASMITIDIIQFICIIIFIYLYIRSKKRKKYSY